MRPLRTSEKQWLFPIATLKQTPSQDVGMSYEVELQKRALCISYIRSLAARAGMTAVDHKQPENGGRAKGVLTVAATLVHRFYMRRSIQDFPPEIIAPTILFIASKIEEEPQKLRFIVNHCLEKFDHAGDKVWMPQGEHGPHPEPEYLRWESDILACEEIAHEALCFDMTVDQPGPVFQTGVTGLDELWADGAGPAGYGLLLGPSVADIPAVVEPAEEEEEGEVMESSQGRETDRRPKAETKLNERTVMNLGWSLLNELYLYPLPVLYHPIIIAFACFQLSLQALLPADDTVPARVAELAPRFGLDAHAQGTADDQLGDMDMVKDCLRDIDELIRVDLKLVDGSNNVERPDLKVMWGDWVRPIQNHTLAPYVHPTTPPLTGPQPSAKTP